MKTKYIYAIIFVLGITCLWQWLENNKTMASLARIEHSINSYREQQTSNYSKQLEFTASFHDVLVPTDSITSDSNYTLIYVYTNTQCGKCITEDISILRNHIDSASCCIFPVLQATRSNIAIINSDLYELNYHRLDHSSVNFPMVDHRPVRFMMVVNTEGEMLSPFYPSIASEKEKIKYLDFVKEKYHL